MGTAGALRRLVLAEAGLTPADLDAVACSVDPRLMPGPEETGLNDDGDVMRKMYAEQARLAFRR